MSVRRVARTAFSGLVIVATVLGLLNVMGENQDVRAAAQQVAGDGNDCSIVREDRFPFWQTFGLSSKKGPVSVTCTRTYYLVGDWQCARN